MLVVGDMIGQTHFLAALFTFVASSARAWFVSAARHVYSTVLDSYLYYLLASLPN